MNHKNRTLARFLFCLLVVTSPSSYLMGMDPGGSNDITINAIAGVTGGVMLCMVSCICCLLRTRNQRGQAVTRVRRNNSNSTTTSQVVAVMPTIVQDIKTEGT